MPTFTAGSPLDYAQNIFGNGATVSQVTQIGAAGQIRIFSSAGPEAAAGVTPHDSGLIISTGNAATIGNGNTVNDNLTNNMGQPGDSDLNNTVGSTNSADAAGLVITFRAEQDGTFTIPLTFMTEEYPEWVGSQYSDSAAVYLNGQLVPISGQQGGYFNINSMQNGPFLDNGDTDSQISYPTDYNAIKTGTITLNVVKGQEYTLKIVIADYGDATLDSALLIGESAFFCFARGTLIETCDGPRPIETLRVGDLVQTRDNGLQPIRWLAMSHLSPERLAGNPRLRPVTIRAGALGADGAGRPLPDRDLTVSPQHRVLLKSRIARRQLGHGEVLVAAVRLVGQEGIGRDASLDAAGVDYFHMLFDRHEIVLSNGAETESFYTGPEAIKSLDTAARRELAEIFPQLFDPAGIAAIPAPVRPVPASAEVRDMLTRHRRQQRALVDSRPVVN